MSDGEGIDTVLGLGGVGEGNIVNTLFFLLAVFFFCICLLNLFIAVHGNAYSESRHAAMELHLQERASICLYSFMQPSWPPKRPSFLSLRLRWPPLLCSFLLFLVALPMWGLLLSIQPLPPVISSMVLLGAVVVSNMFLLQRPWESEEVRARSYLWWCAPLRSHGSGWSVAKQSVDLEMIAECLERGMKLQLSDHQHWNSDRALIRTRNV